MRGGARFIVGLNLMVFGLMGPLPVSGSMVRGLMPLPPAMGPDKGRVMEEEGREATGLATTILSVPLISIYTWVKIT